MTILLLHEQIAQAMPGWNPVTLLGLGEDLVLYFRIAHVYPFLKAPLWLLAEPIGIHKETKNGLKDCLAVMYCHSQDDQNRQEHNLLAVFPKIQPTFSQE